MTEGPIQGDVDCDAADSTTSVPLYADRPAGLSSRLTRSGGARQEWIAPNGQSVDLPVTLDLVYLHPVDHSVVWSITGTVEVRGGEPRLTRVVVESQEGLDIVRLQREFRWASPLDVVRRAVPALIERGVDPYAYDFPSEGYPKAAEVGGFTGWRLTDDFLEEIARRYLELGRGYASTIARERSVTPRTAVSWVEKARRRGILSATKPGSHGGEIIPADRRQPRAPTGEGPRPSTITP